MISPWRASDGEVRKNSPLSSMVERPGEVAEGEIITMPLGRATFWNAAPVAPEQSAPMMPETFSELISRSAAADGGRGVGAGRIPARRVHRRSVEKQPAFAHFLRRRFRGPPPSGEPAIPPDR